jgi:putative hemolysin
MTWSMRESGKQLIALRLPLALQTKLKVHSQHHGQVGVRLSLAEKNASSGGSVICVCVSNDSNTTEEGTYTRDAGKKPEEEKKRFARRQDPWIRHGLQSAM